MPEIGTVDRTLLSYHVSLYKAVIFCYYKYSCGVRDGAVGSVTALQVGRSRVRILTVSLKYFIDIILPVSLMALGLTQPVTEMSTRNISWG